MSQKAAVGRFDAEAFFAALGEKLRDRCTDGQRLELKTLRVGIEDRVGSIFAQNRHLALDEVSRKNLLFTSMILATYRTVREVVNGSDEAMDLIRETMGGLFQPMIREYMKERFDVEHDKPGEAFSKIAANFVARGEVGLGAGFVYEQELQSERQSFINVKTCFFLDFFKANGAPEVTDVLCAMDSIWADELNNGTYNVTFQRPALMSSGGDKCRFQFTRTG